MRSTALALALVAMVVLSGCSVLESDEGPTAEFAEEAEFPTAAVVDDPVTFKIHVNNTADTSGTYEAAVQVDGETATSEDVSVDAGGETTVTLEHTFSNAGNYTVSLAGEERTITAYETPSDFFIGEDFNQGSRVTEQEMTVTGEMQFGTETVDFGLEGNGTQRTNYTAETQYVKEETTISVGGEVTEETTEEWIVNDTLYTKTVDHSEGETEYNRSDAEEFDAGDDDELSPSELQQYLKTDHTDEEYVFIVEADNPADATELMQALGSGEDDDLPPEKVTSFRMEYRVDREMNRPAELTMEMTLENWESFTVFSMTQTETVVAWGEPVNVTVPQDVTENTG